MDRQERLRMVQQAHTSWEEKHEGSVEPDLVYSKKGDSQYPEGILDVSASAEAQAELVRWVGTAHLSPAVKKAPLS